ncbi:MAG: immunoglobulin domain-containing protein [Candidatus Kapabacteria bacterium]|nr:immunoglobulin domain-containing protein [Candidatus Kapabacteria bacterium]
MKLLDYISNLYKNIYSVFIILAIFVLGSQQIIAKQNGSKTGLTSNTSQGCGQTCHGNNSNSATSLSIASDNGQFSTTPNGVLTFTLTVSSAGKIKAGVDIAVKTTTTGSTNAGTLAPISGEGIQSYLTTGELTHTSPGKTMTGGSVTFRFTWTAPPAAGTYYLRAIGIGTNGNGSEDANDLYNWLAVTTLTVSAGGSITINAPNGGEAWCQGSTQNITWTASGSNTCKIELSSDGGSSFPTTIATGVSSSAGSYSWNIPSGQTAGNQYKIKITDEANSSITATSAANFTINAVTAIGTQPVAAAGCTGQPTSFSVVANGSNLTYQWRKGGTNINGATSSSYPISSVAASDAGSYDCLVTGTCGSATSNAAILTVKVTPSVIKQPLPIQTCIGTKAIFFVDGLGTNLSYKWQKNGLDINGAANSATFQISSVNTLDVGNYSCIVSGDCTPPAVSQAAALSIFQNVFISTDLVAIDACEGTAASLSVTASGDGLTYIWTKDAAVISGQSTNKINFTTIAKTDAGSYQVTIKDACGNQVLSKSVQVTIIAKPSISTQPSNQTVSLGGTANFSVTAGGANLTYQWRKDGTGITGKNAASLQITNATTNDAGNYDCVVTNNCGSVTSNAASLQISGTNNPVLTLAQSSFNFPTTPIGVEIDTVLKAYISNTGLKDLTVTAINVNGADFAQFKLIGPATPFTLKTNETKDINIGFKPNAFGTKNAKLDFVSNSVTNPSLLISGMGGSIDLVFNDKQFVLKTTTLNKSVTKSSSIANNGNLKATLNYTIEGTDKAEFTTSLAQGTVIDGGKSTPFDVTFLAKSVVNASAVLKITCAETGIITNINLSGQVTSSVNDQNIIGEVFKVYPTPASDFLRFESLKEFPIDIKIIDIFGLTVAELNVNANEKLEFNLRNQNGKLLPIGLYHAVCYIGDKKAIEKISIVK